MAPSGQAQPQKSLFPIIVNIATETNMDKNITGIPLPLSRNRNGFSITQRGLGCILIPFAKEPKGNIESIANTKKITTNEMSRMFRVTHDFIKSTSPIRLKTALIQTRGNFQKLKNPGAFWPLPCCPHKGWVINNTKSNMHRVKTNLFRVHFELLLIVLPP